MASAMNTESRTHQPTPFLDRVLTLNWEVIIYLIIFLLAVFTRFYALGDRVMSHDESLHTVYSYNLYDRGFFEHTPLMHGPILFHFTALSYALFGPDDFSARIYPAVLGIIIVMMPLLMRRWLGRTGAILASIMLLISPLMLYYSRYIRHDIPSILAGMVMFYAAMMYLSGPENQRRRAHWLYILSAAMIWNLGSKETAFIYVAIFGAFLTLYWLVRLAQHFYNINGKPAFYTITTGILLGGVATLGLIVVISISLGTVPTLAERLTLLGDQFGFLFSGQPISVEFSTFLSWTALTFLGMFAIITGPALWVYRNQEIKASIVDLLALLFAALVFFLITVGLGSSTRTVDGEIVRTSTAAASFAVGLIAAVSILLIYATFRLPGVRTFRSHLGVMLAIVFVACAALIIFEELSHQPSRTGTETAQPVIPGEDGEMVGATTDFTVAPLILVWMIGIVSVAGMFFMRAKGWWKVLHDHFPEFDVLLVMGSLILPWLTAVFIVSTRGSSQDFIEIGTSIGGLSNLVPVAGAEQVGRVVVGFLAWVPMMTIAIVTGLMWNWRRWLICFAVFHGIFAFFFTTVFTNIYGLASGMVYSLQYWLEQQGVRRGSQPQYYYLTIIMPMYEFLPVIGGTLAMLAGMVMFWRKRKTIDEAQAEMLAAEVAGQSAAVENTGNTESEPVAEAPPPQPEQSVTPADNPARASVWKLTEVPFLLFVGWWTMLTLYGYTLAGEKMPWLGTHLTTPLILLAGWYFGRIIDQVDLKKLAERGWLYLMLLPFLIVALFQVIAPLLGGQPPFTGTQQIELRWTYNWLAALFTVAVIGVIVVRLAAYTGWRQLRQGIAIVTFAILSMLTFRAAWMAAYINYDLATEYLVYAHGAPANKFVTEQLADLSIRTTGGMDAKILYDNKFSWPGSWYMRDFNNAVFIGENTPTLQQLDDATAIIVGDTGRPRIEPLVEDRFQRFDYIRMWWPNQDYFGMTSQRINNLFDLSNQTSATTRRGMFEIWWARDFTTYGQAIGRNITLTSWSPSDPLYVYIRKDFAAQVWPYGVGDATVTTPFTQVEVNLCTANWQQLEATVIFDEGQNQLIRPLGITVDAEGRLLVADEGTHRISFFSVDDGAYLTSLGQQGAAAQEGAFFERPHSVAVDPESGEIYIVDTWNYRIRAFDSDSAFIGHWGQPLTSGFDAPREPTDGFWGPRDIAVDDQGRVYVSDTGNKRIRVYDFDGTFLWDIGSGGSGEGQLNEPAGIALHPDGRLFVADTWNRRIAVFTQEGVFLENYPVRGWYDELGNRPYLAVDPVRDLLYVADPDAGRVLVYDVNGDCVGAFGQFNRESPNRSQFATIGGMAVDADGYVYVSDLGSGRVLKFEPFERPPADTEFDEMDDPIDTFDDEFEDILPELTEELEVTGDEDTEIVIPELDEPESTEEQ